MPGDKKSAPEELGRLGTKSVPVTAARSDDWHDDTVIEPSSWRPALGRDPDTRPDDPGAVVQRAITESRGFRSPTGGGGAPRAKRKRKRDRRTAGSGLAPDAIDAVDVAAFNALAPPAPAKTIAPPSGEPLSTAKVDRIARSIKEVCESGPGQEGPAVQMLVSLGADALPKLAEAFPGALWFNRHEPHRRLPRAAAISGAARAMLAFGAAATRYTRPMLVHPHPDVRYYGALVHAELLGEKAAPDIAPLLFDADAGLCHAALLLLEGISRRPDGGGQALADVLAALRGQVEQAGPRRIAAIRAVGVMRDPKAVPHLTTALDGSPEEVAAAHRVLVALTGQDLGAGKPKKWRSWHGKHASLPRHEWLVRSMLHPSETVRKVVAKELDRLTGDWLGFVAGDGKSARKQAQKTYREWFAKHHA